jgi:alginate O-acetyltransferase complex protein AlgI
MKNYLYIPLGGNQVTTAKIFRNLIIVFLFSGLWHGASWNFVLWGAYHGSFLILERLFLGKILNKIGKIPATLFSFIVIVTGWVLFRNENLGFAVSFMKKMYSFHFFDGKFALQNDFWFSLTLAVLFSFFAAFPKTLHLQNLVYGEKFNSAQKSLLLVACILLYYISLSYISAFDFNPFIYFRF